MNKPLRILFVTSELAPVVSTGGLAEIAASLPRALHNQGHDVRLALPCYRQVPQHYRGDQYCLCKAELGSGTAHGALRVASVPDTKIPLYLVEHEGFFGREAPYGVGAYEYGDNAERFCFFCQALLDGIAQTGWKPDIIHCNDWHAAPVPLYLKSRFRRDPFWAGMPSLFTIHNLAYQGRYGRELFGATGLDEGLFTPECLEYEGDMNLMKGALVLAEKINTVSPRYAREIQTVEYGAGLHDVLGNRRGDLSGILNGVDYDVWHPSADPFIAANYDGSRLTGKGRCKRALLELFGLPEAKVPLFGMVSRLHWQKGIDLFVEGLETWMRHDMQIVVLGSGDPAMEGRILDAARRYPDKLGVYLGFDARRAHALQAGSDFFLMPSRYEPCGLGQLYAMAYGTIPIVRRTGGLADTVVPYSPLGKSNKTATGISFVPQTWQALTRAVLLATDIFNNPPLFRQIRKNGMAQDYSWDRSSNAYVDLYRAAIQQGEC